MNKGKGASWFGKVSSVFGGQTNQVEVIEGKQGDFLGDLKNRFFRSSKDVAGVDVVVFEQVACDFEVEVIVKTPKDSQELISSKNSDLEVTFIQKTILQVSDCFDNLKDMASSSLDVTKCKLDQAKDVTLQFTESTANSLVQFKQEVGNRYESIELSPKFYSLMRSVDCVVVISLIKDQLKKHQKGSKEFIALSCIITLLMILDKSKEGFKQGFGIPSNSENVDQDLLALLKSVSFKDVVETAEPILLIIPNGNYILLILKLFV